MAIDMAGRRAEGVMPVPPDKWRGSVGKDENGSAVGGMPNLPTTEIDATSHPADAGRVNRGMEANTDKAEGSNVGEPTYDVVTAGEKPVSSEPFAVPDNSGLMATDKAHSDWDDSMGFAGQPDGSARNQRSIDLSQLSTFDMIGEEPQGEGAGEAMEGGE